MFKTDDERVLVLRTLCVLAGVMAVALVAGTFVDLQLTSALYVAEQPLAQLISAVGLLPLTVPLCVMLGVLAQRTWAGDRAPVAKVLSCAVMVVLAAYAGYAMAKSCFTYDGIGPLLPFQVPTAASAAIGVLLAGALVAWGFSAARNNDEAELYRRAFLTVLLLVAAFLIVEVVKNVMHRPRYRTLVLGHAGIEFMPWYRPFHGSAELMAQYGLASDAFKSFPSGHSVQTASLAIAFYGLAALFPALRSKWKLAVVLQVVLLVCVLPSRMILGAHFLSDVAVGSLVALCAGIYLYSRRDS